MVPINEHELLLGSLGVAASSSSISRARAESIESVGLITLIMIAIGTPLTMLITRRKLRPLKTIIDQLKNADFDNFSFQTMFRSNNELGYLAETLRVMGIKLNRAQKEAVENERMSKELEIANEIQEGLLLRKLPQGKNFEVATLYRSAKQVGGDYFDFIPLGENHLGVLVADVSGKSLPGMLVMLMTRDLVRHVSRTLLSPSDILKETNRELRENIKAGMFVTMFFGILDVNSGQFTFASAGHNPLIVFDGKTRKCRCIKTKGFPLGVMPPDVFDQRLEAGEVWLAHNDRLIQYTDGVNEALNEIGDELGMESYLRIIESNECGDSEKFVQRLRFQHDEFVGRAEQYDDITFVTVRWKREQTENRNELANAKSQHAIR